jgi:hypothetical protein
VLRGAERSLRAEVVRFVSFEYNTKWAAAGIHSLAGTVTWLSGLGYDCHLITKEGLIPLYGRWWDDAYEFWQWSNVLSCAGGRHCASEGARLACRLL